MEECKVFHTDVLVAGSGIAGLMAAYSAASSPGNPKVTVITKNVGCASNHVLGFNAPVSEDDSHSLYAEDTLRNGAYINDKKLVRVLAERAGQEVQRMYAAGMVFDKDLLKPLGCSVPRLVHSKNSTGRDTVRIYRQLLEEKKVAVMEGMTLADVITVDNQVKGAVAFDEKEDSLVVIEASAVVLATGGIHIAEGSTYPEFMTGDGYGIAYRAGARLTDMEFIQFEPCRCIFPQKLGISTTLLSSGGVLKNCLGERFLLEYYPDEGSVPKDVLARLIALEVQKGNGSEHGGVYLDLTDVDKDIIKEGHRLYYERFQKAGIDLTTTVVEVGPCAHSFMGGICIDEHCRTDVKGLFAVGEAAGGIHGANRVGGNAGTEVYVFGNIAGQAAAEYLTMHDVAGKAAEEQGYSTLSRADTKKDARYWEAYLGQYAYNGSLGKEEFQKIKQEVLEVMHRYLGPVRCEEGLQKASDLIEALSQTLESMMPKDFAAMTKKAGLRNLLTVCRLSCKAALARKESRGAHYRIDYPECREEYCRNYIHGNKI